MRDKDLQNGDLASLNEKDRRRKAEAMSDAELLGYYASLHASRLIEDTVWAPIIEREIARRGLVVSN